MTQDTVGFRAVRVVGARCAVATVALVVVAACTQSAERPIQGYVEGEYVRVAAPFAGALIRLSVKRGAEVVAGAPLFALERENEVAARRQSEQQLQAAEARLENLRSGKRPPEVLTVEEQLRQAIATRDLAVTNLERQKKLFASGFISAAAIDDARTEVKRDEAAVAQLRAAVDTAKLPARTDEIRAAEADARAAKEALAQADWRLSQRAIASPATGRVNDTYYVPGDWVAAGIPVVSLLPPANVKIRFFVPEPVLGRMRSGQTVSFSCDGCATGMSAPITFISDRAEFTPPVLYSRENRAKLVYLVEASPVPELAAKLNPGQPVDVVLPQ
ncbi:MAG: HlyD family efflux transporter periplasmic adaptor subunit [Betaproteobacteria bacterium]